MDTVLTRDVTSGGDFESAVAVRRVGAVPRQQLLNTVDRMIADALNYVAQIRFGVEAVELGRADQAVNGRSTLASGV